MDRKTINYFKSKQKTIEERFEEGKVLRDKFSRKEQGDYKPDPKRADPVSILEEQGKTRLTELVPIRYARMLTSPFAFLRGAAAIMAADLAVGPKTTGINVQTCGDMHVANFGIFASAERNLIFGINDFDETLPGPWEWDIKRLVTSIVASGRFLGAKNNLCVESVLAAVNSYKKSMRNYSEMGHIELVYATMTEKDLQRKLPPEVQKGLKKITDKARERTHFQVLDKMANIVDNKYRLRDDAPFIVHETHTKSGRTVDEALGLFLESYMLSLADDRKQLLKHYRIVDVARKVVGVGSVGTRCWIVFMLGSNSEDPLFLQIKEAQPSVLEPFISKSIYTNHGQRVVAGQRLLQAAPDIFLGWGEQDGIHFYVRQLRDMKGGLEFDPDKVNINNYPEYCKLCGEALALAHAKSGDAAMISGYLGKSDEFDQAMVQFASAYADQTEKDYQALEAAAASGRIKVARAES
ncbi:uncharacterized protein (DUF2252 family) [Flavobacterium sp. 103]|uniref:DUF2252 domain-containing protein n=1 Tax=Flavobacterium sp. M31R6 TaxID=2739062 RepID=UPI000D5D1EAD|nr:DUF2252 domain-containing protein [Flavobacterium sp. M31R6]PVX47143.1 uncharacterized protein (DUF2252 family) [Flavobacterium sp. 103]QKJ64319.1 DUF2252 domain-containing protein [Flavobacterium sp. M31R6]